jgi:hypothetical protein
VRWGPVRSLHREGFSACVIAERGQGRREGKREGAGAAERSASTTHREQADESGAVTTTPSEWPPRGHSRHSEDFHHSMLLTFRTSHEQRSGQPPSSPSSKVDAPEQHSHLHHPQKPDTTTSATAELVTAWAAPMSHSTTHTSSGKTTQLNLSFIPTSPFSRRDVDVLASTPSIRSRRIGCGKR